MIPTTYQKGDTIKVKINGREYETVIGDDNIQRFKVNKLFRDLVFTKKVNLNQLGNDFQRGIFTLQEYMEFYMGLGYSICSFKEIFGQGDSLLEIDNPLDK